MADTSGFSILPGGPRRQEQGHNPVPPGISVIYIDRGDGEDGGYEPRACAPAGVGGMRAAARALHRMADRVEAMRRSIERGADARR